MLLWADGFDHYGASADFVNSSVYVYNTNSGSEPLQIGTNPALIRTGNRYWRASDQVYSNWYGGRMVGGTATTLGAGAAFYFSGPPSQNNYCPFIFTGNGKTDHQASVHLMTDGSLAVMSGSGGAMLGQSNPGVIAWGSYAYIEAKVVCDTVAGSVTVRVNNNVVLVVAGINTDPLATGKLNGVMCGTSGNYGSSGSNTLCQAISDFVIWDGSGGRNDNFLGDIRCRTTYTSANGPLQDWIATGVGSAFNALNNVPADPAKYISGQNVGDTSSFPLTDIPTNTGFVFGVVLQSHIYKSDAGICEVTMGLNSNGSVDTAAPIAPGTGASYYPAIFETDPDGGGNWSVAAINALVVQMERTA